MSAPMTDAPAASADYAQILARLRADGFASAAAALENELTTKFGAEALALLALPITRGDLIEDAAGTELSDTQRTDAADIAAARVVYEESTATAAALSGAGSNDILAGSDSLLNDAAPAVRFAKHVPYATFTHNRDPCVSAAFTPDGTFMATASATGLVTLSRTGLIFESPPDTAGGARSADSSVGLVKRFDDVRTPLTSLHFHPSEPVIVTTAADGWLRFMDQSRTPERLIAASVRDSHPLITAVSHPSGDWVLVAAHHPLPRLYDAATLTPHVLLGGPAAARRAQLEAAGVTTAAAVPGALAAAVDADAGALFSSAADVDLAALGLHTRPITSLAYSPLGDLFASASADGSVRVWDTVSGALVHAFSRAHLGGAGSVAFAPSGKFILTAGADGTAKVFDLRTMTQSVVMQAGAPATPSDPRSGHWPTYGSAAFAASADHVLVACQASGGSVSVHDIVAGGRHVATVPNLHPAGRLLTVTQCPGKSMFVTTGGGDGRAVVCALDGE